MLLAGAPKDEEEGLCGALLRHGTTLVWFTGLHLIHPGYPLRRGILAAAVYANIGFLYPVQVDNRQFRIWFGCLCSGWYRSRFSRVVGLVSFVFHYWGDGRLCLRLRGVLLWIFVGFALTASWSFVSAGDGMEIPVSLVA